MATMNAFRFDLNGAWSEIIRLLTCIAAATASIAYARLLKCMLFSFHKLSPEIRTVFAQCTHLQALHEKAMVSEERNNFMTIMTIQWSISKATLFVIKGALK